MMGLFCSAEYATTESVQNIGSPHDLAEVFGNDVAQVFENTVKMFVWLSRRYYEVVLFRNLQDAANRMNSLSINELSDIAIALLDVLSIGLLEICKAEESFLVSMNTSR
jgi:hypothetical protein